MESYMKKNGFKILTGVFCIGLLNACANTDTNAELVNYTINTVLSAVAAQNNLDIGELNVSGINQNNSGVSSQSSGHNLNYLIDMTVKNVVNQINSKDPQGYRYTLLNKKTVYTDIKYSDINNDGIKDAVTSILTCEETNCHMTTRDYTLAVFIGVGNNKYINGDAKTLLGVNGSVVSVNNGLIRVQTTHFYDSDPHCCPSKTLNWKYRFKNNSLIKVY